jgi:site-specific recombinase XerD
VPKYAAERALAEDGVLTSWIVVSDEFELHDEAVAYLLSLRARGCSPNTQRMYAGRLAIYLTYCDQRGMNWASPTFVQLHAFLRWLVDTPVPARRRGKPLAARHRSESTANNVMTVVGEFLRFGVPSGWVTTQCAAMLSSRKYLTHLPPGLDAGEDGQYRTVTTTNIKFKTGAAGYRWLSEEQLERLTCLPMRARDRFLVALLSESGVRIGEALGLHREDMHLLANSSSLNCPLKGPHIHVQRRLNANGALAKSRHSRTVPVVEDVVGLYADYGFERAAVRQARDCPFVFVNLFGSHLGAPMTYGNVRRIFEGLSDRLGFRVRPHMLRHTAATRWIRNDVPRDVAQNLLGHISPASMEPYVHASDTDKRSAVDRLSALRSTRI